MILSTSLFSGTTRQRPRRSCLAAMLIGLSVALAGCTSPDDPPASSTLLRPASLADIGCGNVSGQLDALQVALGDALAGAERPVAGDVAVLLNTAIDGVDAIIAGAQSLAEAPQGGDPALLTPVLDQLLCISAALGEVLQSLVDSTPLADQAELNRLLALVVSIQEHLSAALVEIAASGMPPTVATLLAETTYALTGVIEGTLGVGRLPADSQLAAVLTPVNELILELSGAFTTLADGDIQGFANQLLGSVPHLVNELSEALGPLDAPLDNVELLLDSVLSQLAGFLGQLLDVLL